MRTPQLRSIPYIRVLHSIVQWNLSNPDTNGAEESVIVSESSFQRLKEWYLGWEKVSCLERCPQFRSVNIAQYKSVSLSLSDLPILISSLDSLHILLLLLVIYVCIGEDHLGKVSLRYPPFLRVKPVKLGVCGECIM